MSLVVEVLVRRGGFEVAASFAAEAGETLALVGPNGSGKSTLVAAVAGLLPPAAGRIELDGHALDDVARGTRLPPEERSIGVVFQDLRLFPHLDAVENVGFPLRARGADRHAARARALELLDRLGVRDRAGARPAGLSGGEAQRVALARALVAEPALLLLDEPLSALDVGARPRVRDELCAELRRFPGVRVVVTHDPVEAATLGDRLVLLEEGRVTQVGTPEEIRSAPRTRYAGDLVGVNAVLGRLESLGGGLARIVAEGGEIVVPSPPGAEGRDVVAVVRPAHVTVSREPPDGSARNVLAGRVLSVAVEGDRARLRLATTPPLVADLTLASVERLGLREGTAVWASFKAVEVEVLPA